MIINLARKFADNLVEQMRPYCERIEVAGSIRRNQAEVKDIEIVCIPKRETQTVLVGLFGEEKRYDINRLHSWATNDTDLHGIQWIKPGVSGIEPWAPKPNGKYWRGVLPEGIKLDLFLCTPKNWGAILLIRTGSADFSQAVVTRAKQMNRPCVEGHFTIAGVPVETLEERDVFDLLNLRYVEPQNRQGRSDLREVAP